MSLADKVLIGSKAPIMECIMTDSLIDQGLGYVIMARRASAGKILLSNFLVDRYIDASAGQQLVEMGRAGRPFYISGPYESESDSFEILSKLNKARESGVGYVGQISESAAMQLLGQSDGNVLAFESDVENSDDDASEYQFEEESDAA